MSGEWRFCLAGPLEIRHKGIPVPVDAAKQRVLIAVLALAAGEPVGVERLITCLWGDQPPASARTTLQNYVLRLRRTFHVDSEPGPLVSSAAGYRLDVDPEAVDVYRFRTLVRSARAELSTGETGSAAALLDEALALWRGAPLVDVPSEALHREVAPALVEQHLDALEQRIDIDLDLGRHRERITDLIALTTEHPVREKTWAQLMLALYRSGRTGEALETYRQAGKVLAEELGTDPGPELKSLHQAILSNDPSLTITDPAPGPTGQRPVAPRPVPRQLPPPSRHFVGRAQELRRLSEPLESVGGSRPVVISAIGGSAGIGKTALALHWGHQHAEKFPDGQLYVNLRGFDPTGTPMPPTTALHGFLTALGVPAPEVPAELDGQITLYRSHMAGRRMLVVLDNARSPEQVRPLLPSTPGCVVLVTSRDQLAGLIALDSAVPLTLDLLTQEEARDLLTGRLGRDRVTREQAAVNELIDRCARLPLALNITAAHATLNPQRPLATLVEELGDAHRRLDTLSTGEANGDVRVVFSWSYHALTPASARVFRLLGVHPGPDISLPATASLTGLDSPTTRQALDELARAHLITEHTPGRYTLHDLLRAYATEQVHLHDEDAERRAALRRVVEFYTHTACAAELVLAPLRDPIALEPLTPGVHLQSLPEPPMALGWFEAEYPNLLAAQQAAGTKAWHPIVWQLAWSVASVQIRRGPRHDHLAVWQAALDAATHLPDPSARMLAHRRVCVALADLGRTYEAIEHGRQALSLAEGLHDLGQDAAAHHVLAWAWGQLGDRQALEHALEHAEHTLNLRRALGEPLGEAQALNQVGWYLAQLGDFEAARTHCENALAIQRRVHDPENEEATLDSLGYIAHHSGHHRQAIEYYQQALPLLADLGHCSQTADTLENLGHPHAALGEYEQARTAWRKALELYRQQGRDKAADLVQQQLNTLDHPDG